MRNKRADALRREMQGLDDKDFDAVVRFIRYLLNEKRAKKKRAKEARAKEKRARSRKRTKK